MTLLTGTLVEVTVAGAGVVIMEVAIMGSGMDGWGGIDFPYLTVAGFSNHLLSDKLPVYPPLTWLWISRHLCPGILPTWSQVHDSLTSFLRVFHKPAGFIPRVGGNTHRLNTCPCLYPQGDTHKKAQKSTKALKPKEFSVHLSLACFIFDRIMVKLFSQDIIYTIVLIYILGNSKRINMI